MFRAVVYCDFPGCIERRETALQTVPGWQSLQDKNKYVLFDFCPLHKFKREDQ